MTSARTKTDVVQLPSGAEIDLYSVDLDCCRTPDDAWELQQALQAKIIEIEFQLECYGLGYGPSGDPLSPQDAPPILWQARAKKALAWAKLSKSDANRRFQQLVKVEKDRTMAPVRRQRAAEGIVTIARNLVALWQNQKIVALPRSERNGAIDSTRDLMIKAILNWEAEYGTERDETETNSTHCAHAR